MLTELVVDNFAIIEHLELNLASGLITFTGETGAGKSIIIDAVEALMGERADVTFVRSGSERAVVEGVFQLSPAAFQPLIDILRREELLDEAEYLTLEREIRNNGRSVARVNGHSVNASLLKEIGEYLIDLHGQSEHLSLLRVNQHLGLLDSYAEAADLRLGGAGLAELRRTYQDIYRQLQQIAKELEQVRLSEQDSARRSDMLTYQINEIEAAHLKDGEEEKLRDERNRLANAEGLASAVQESLLALDEGTPESPAATDLLGQVVHALNGLARLDPSQTALLDSAQAIFDNLSDLSRSLRLYLEEIEFNPKRLDQVEERLALIHTLKRKYGDSIAAILEFAQKAGAELDSITHAGERIEKLEKERNKLLAQLGQAGMALSQLRKSAAGKLSQAIENELFDLNMTGAQFKVDFQTRPNPEGAPVENGERLAFDANGLERVEFLIAPNPGEGFKPLAKIASGGETSRLMLALKNVLAQADQIPTLIFDEIDQGIGGRIGTIVGQKLWNLARAHQVLCITHLPQLAAFGDQHFQVQKLVSGERTTTQVKDLAGEARVLELAQMMGDISEGTLHSARELIQSVQKRTV
jgi:DNA repair protein RecN (Recombination protein N)